MTEEEELKAARKKASQVGVLWGGIALMVGALICLVYLLIYEPWKMPAKPQITEGVRP